MATILKSTDFVAEYSVPQDSSTKLVDFFPKQEKEILLYLLGKELYNLFVAQLENDPLVLKAAAPQRFKDLFNEIIYQPDGGEIIYSRGMKPMLMRFVYFTYMADQVKQKTKGAVTMPSSENSENAGYKFNLEDAYNEAVSDYIAIQKYIEDNLDTYPEYAGQPKSYIYL